MKKPNDVYSIVDQKIGDLKTSREKRVSDWNNSSKLLYTCC